MSKTTTKGRPCQRCGIQRKPGRLASVLCTDCKYVLTEEERKVWMKPVAA